MFSKINLSLKWRPKFFKDFIGHKNIIEILINSLKSNKIHNCYLFYGSHGIGKTSLARIFAKSLNCIKGITNNFCGKCSNCINIDLSKSSDVIEIDAASRTKIDDIKEILDNINYLPISMRYKIYIIDEIHMLSRYSFNFLLKILEEPPKHIKFILATTEISKIPDTILSRCISFYLKSLSIKSIIKRINYILYKEKIKLNDNVIKIISLYCKGSMRDALNILDQLLMLNLYNKISLKKIYSLLDVVDYRLVLLFMKYLFIKNNKIFYLLNKLNDLDINYDNFLLILIENIHNILLLFLYPKYKYYLNKYFIKINFLINFKKLLDLKDIIFYYKLFLLCKKNIFIISNKRIIFEFYVIRAFIYKNIFYNY